jgi:uncharacterized membrane protein YfcA
LIMVMEPLTMAGAVFGAYLSKVLPDWFLVISLMLVLGYTTDKTLRKGISLYRKETTAFQLAEKGALAQAVEMTAIEESVGLLSMVDGQEELHEARESTPELDAILEAER